MTLQIVFVDNHILVVNKPAGLLTQPSGTDQDSLEEQCKKWIKEKYNKPGAVFLHAIHRLDKQVSGLVLFARTSKALSRLNESMRAKEPAKTYLAYVEGSLPATQGTLENYLIHDSHQAKISDPSDPQAKLARLHYRVIEKSADKSLVEVTLDTGRYHQIRAQMAAAGAPIIGDKKYGSKAVLPGGTIALHHYRLQIQHPITREIMTFECRSIIYYNQKSL